MFFMNFIHILDLYFGYKLPNRGMKTVISRLIMNIEITHFV